MTWTFAKYPPWCHSDEQRCAEGFIYGVKVFTSSTPTQCESLEKLRIEYRLTYQFCVPVYHTVWFRTYEQAATFQVGHGLPQHNGKRKGGFARAASLTPDRRSEIARLAAQTRWGNA